MGDRANVFVVDRTPEEDVPGETSGIYLYTHWNGYQWPEMLRIALDLDIARRRWADPSYLIRIVAMSLFEDCAGGERGGGIGTTMDDNEHPIIILDIPNQTVAFALQGHERNRSRWACATSFEEFCSKIEGDYPADRIVEEAIR